jgi:RNA 2',3'-cyclic 3'-phosphodiesterase
MRSGKPCACRHVAELVNSLTLHNMTAPRRLFVALMADDDMRNAVETARSARAWPPGARMVPRHNLHLTLHFLGDAGAPEEARLVEALAGVQMPELQLTFRSSAVWHGGVVVLLADDAPALDALRRDTGAAVTAAGLVSDPQWTPHVTLAWQAAAVQTPTEIDPITWAPQAMSLVWSRRDASGYEAVRSWPAIKRQAPPQGSQGEN